MQGLALKPWLAWAGYMYQAGLELNEIPFHLKACSTTTCSSSFYILQTPSSIPGPTPLYWAVPRINTEVGGQPGVPTPLEAESGPSPRCTGLLGKKILLSRSFSAHHPCPLSTCAQGVPVCSAQPLRRRVTRFRNWLKASGTLQAREPNTQDTEAPGARGRQDTRRIWQRWSQEAGQVPHFVPVTVCKPGPRSFVFQGATF